MNSIIEQLKQLRHITPDPVFTEKSRALLLGARKQGFPFERVTIWSVFQHGTAMALTSVLLLVIASIPLLRSTLPLRIAGLDPAILSAEAEGLQLSIRLSEIQSYRRSQETIGQALANAAQKSPVQVNHTILEEEEKTIQLTSPVNTEIEDGLRALLE